MNKWLDIIQLSALVATSLGVGIAAYQIWQTKKQSITSFEDDFTRQYRDIIQRIPVKALLNENLSDDDFQKALNEIYNYIDLTNYQIFLRKQNRIRSQTWEILRDGMKANLELPAFKRGWEMIKERTPDNFLKSCDVWRFRNSRQIRNPGKIKISVNTVKQSLELTAVKMRDRRL